MPTSPRQPAAERRDEIIRRIATLATAFEEHPAEVEQARRTRAARHVYWLIGGLCALMICIAASGVLTPNNATNAGLPAPNPIGAQLNDPCAARMATIMDAIAAYAAAHGAPPPDLAALDPDFSAATPVDPVSHQPIGYRVTGESISLSCPVAEPATDAAEPEAGS